MQLKNKKVLVTGGLGFIGFNAACHFSKNNEVVVVDDCSRVGVENNIEQLRSANIEFHKIDISDFKELKNLYFAFAPDVVIHMAAQVAVTLSVENPYRDFKANVVGSFNLLELARISHKKPIMLYASTNKVYGNSLGEVTLKGDRYQSENSYGCSEKQQLSFQTPYGCSKGAADQYFVDYAKSFDIPTVSFRQSCIYGPHQYGMEDQGWLAWFTICSLLNKPLTIYGDGNQVRDVLFIEDLIHLYEKAILNIDSVKGEVFNIGGGPDFSLSLNELIKMLDDQGEQKLNVSYADWRLGDQKVYISDIRKIKAALGWQPTVSPKEGVHKLIEWVNQEKDFIAHVENLQNEARDSIDVSIVIPAKNEEASLSAVLDEVSSFLMSFAHNAEVIVVNDRSTDKTVEIAREYHFVKVVDSQYNPGKGGALRTGFDMAQGKYIVMMDADFSHEIFDLTFMLDEVRKHNGLVVGSRIIGGSEEYTRVRAFGNVILTWFFGFLHGRYLSDALNGFKIFHRDVYKCFEYTSDAYEIEIELLVNTLRLNRLITEVSSRERARMAGEAKSSVIRHGTLFMSRIIFEKFRKPKNKEAVNQKNHKFIDKRTCKV